MTGLQPHSPRSKWSIVHIKNDVEIVSSVVLQMPSRDSVNWFKAILTAPVHENLNSTSANCLISHGIFSQLQTLHIILINCWQQPSMHQTLEISTQPTNLLEQLGAHCYWVACRLIELLCSVDEEDDDDSCSSSVDGKKIKQTCNQNRNQRKRESLISRMSNASQSRLSRTTDFHNPLF